MKSRGIFLGLVVLAIAGLGVSSCRGHNGNVKAFQDRVDKYLQLRRDAEHAAPSLPDKASPEQINAHQEKLASSIREARRGAVQGDIFTPEITMEIRRIIADETKGRSGAPARHAIREGNPRVEGGPPVKLSVNATYPGSAPLSVVPPELLLKLPKLPDELEYRFVGPHLILRDTTASIIVDYLLDVVPARLSEGHKPPAATSSPSDPVVLSRTARE